MDRAVVRGPWCGAGGKQAAAAAVATLSLGTHGGFFPGLRGRQFLRGTQQAEALAGLSVSAARAAKGGRGGGCSRLIGAASLAWAAGLW